MLKFEYLIQKLYGQPSTYNIPVDRAGLQIAPLLPITPTFKTIRLPAHWRFLSNQKSMFNVVHGNELSLGLDKMLHFRVLKWLIISNTQLYFP